MQTVMGGSSAERGEGQMPAELWDPAGRALVHLERVGWGSLHGEVVLELSLTGCVGVFQKEEGRGKTVPEREEPEIRQCFCRAHRK